MLSPFTYQLCKALRATTLMLILGASCLYANHNCQDNTLIPIGRIVLNPEFCDGDVAVGLLGEVGKDNVRGNATIGYALTPSQSIKVGGEYLTQQLKYGFRSGHTKRWVQQWAVGGRYLALFDECFISGVTADAYYSQAGSKKLSARTLSDTQYVLRHIAGSYAAGADAGVLLAPWCGATLTLLADYDYVKFKRRYNADHNTNGFGGSFELTQQLFNGMDLSLKAEIRKPFNNYTARLLYASNNSFGPYTVGLFGGYTHGKSRIPNIATAGIEFGLNFGGAYDYRSDEWGSACCDQVCSSGLANWVLEPAVYMPIVLAARDQRVVNSCVPPQVIAGGIPNMLFPPDSPIFDANTYFSGTNLTWSISSDTPGQVAATISPTGMVDLEYVSGLGAANITITATNACGSVQTTFFALFQTV